MCRRQSNNNDSIDNDRRWRRTGWRRRKEEPGGFSSNESKKSERLIDASRRSDYTRVTIYVIRQRGWARKSQRKGKKTFQPREKRKIKSK